MGGCELQQVFDKYLRNFIYTFLIVKITGRDWIDPIMDLIESDSIEINVIIFREQWVCDFGKFKMLVIMQDATKIMFTKMLQKVIDDAFRFTASSGSDDGGSTFDIIYFELAMTECEMYLKYFIYGKGALFMEIYEQKGAYKLEGDNETKNDMCPVVDHIPMEPDSMARFRPFLNLCRTFRASCTLLVGMFMLG